MSKEFFDALPSLNLEEMDNAFKCLGLAYLGIKFDESDPFTPMHREVSAPTILTLASNAMFKRELQIAQEKS